MIMYLFVLTSRKKTLVASSRQGRSTTTSFTRKKAPFPVKGQMIDRIAQFWLPRALRARVPYARQERVMSMRFPGTTRKKSFNEFLVLWLVYSLTLYYKIFSPESEISLSIKQKKKRGGGGGGGLWKVRINSDL